MSDNSGLRFNISLSVLNHLGRNLYRTFPTVLGEAISNSWDANAHDVRIDIDRDANRFSIKDDGIGMTKADFQEKFLKVGYSKRRDGGRLSPPPEERPYIGRKGIGKLALLSCADRISVISKVDGGEYVGGLIDNAGLDRAMEDDVADYELGDYDRSLFDSLTEDHEHGTIIVFEGIKEGIKNTDDFLGKVIALYFRFSLLDPTFSIRLNGEFVTIEALRDLMEKTQFVWNMNGWEDPLVDALSEMAKEVVSVEVPAEIRGFIASVEKPKDRNIHSTGEKVGVDLFVNGRLRETDLLKHIPTAQIPESYLYGQIFFDALDDDGTDRFTSSREGVLSDDLLYKDFLEKLRVVILSVVDEWDKLRLKYRHEGDPENKRKSKKARYADGVAREAFNEFIPDEESDRHDLVESWAKGLLDDASFNFESYADCFVSENLVRKFMHERGIVPSAGTRTSITELRDKERREKEKGALSIEIRSNNDDLSYLGMPMLAKEVDPRNSSSFDNLESHGYGMAPIRSALMHTALLTAEAKLQLRTVANNIRARVRVLISRDEES